LGEAIHIDFKGGMARRLPQNNNELIGMRRK
jgi:hypothetical protein